MNRPSENANDYYRSLDDLAKTPEFQQLAEREFPGFENVFESESEVEIRADDSLLVSRRNFLAVSAATALAAAGCRRPEQLILPFSAVPDDQTARISPGLPLFYATALPRPGGALPVLVESHEGRPTKVEGNPAHPCSMGKTDAFAQAAPLDLYSPDRVMSDKYPGVVERGVNRTWEEFDSMARSEAEKFLKEKGQGLAFLAEEFRSPSLESIRADIKEALPQAIWCTHEPIDSSQIRGGVEIAFGKPSIPRYHLDRAERILALDCDFLGLDPDQLTLSRNFAAKRRVDSPRDEMNRLYVVEPNFTITGTMADHRLPLAGSQIGLLLIQIARELATTFAGQLKKAEVLLKAIGSVTSQGLPDRWTKAVASDLASHPGKSVVMVGYRQPSWVHALAQAVNDVLGASSAGIVEYREILPQEPNRGIDELAKEIHAGKISTLFILGGNPALNAPADLDFAATIQKVPRSIHLGLFFDRTSELCHWHLPLAHPFESWGDAEAIDGTLCCIQPLIAPLNGDSIRDSTGTAIAPTRGGRSILEVLALFTQHTFPGGDPKTNPPTTSYALAKSKAYDLVQRSFSTRSGIPLTDPAFEIEFNRFKQVGFLPTDRDKILPKPIAAASLEFDPVRILAQLPKLLPPAPTRDGIEIGFVPGYTLFDGRFAMNSWLHELPDPITKLVWDNAALIGSKTAEAMRIATCDLVQIEGNKSSFSAPIFIVPGHAEGSITLTLGHLGEMRISHVPEGGGTNFYTARRSDGLHYRGGFKVTPLGQKADLVTTQEHGVIPEGREIVQELTLEKLREKLAHHPEHAGRTSGQKIGLPPGEAASETEIRQGFQGGYGNPQQPRLPARREQERFPLDLARPELLDSQFQWGMVIDLNSCTGCSACVVACQSENNIPVVGKSEVKRNRELHWLRIDRYFGPMNGSETPTIVSQPVACVHCEQAPCEEVCPVNASVHSPEGLNLQVYNRCIGTRYCANACPYKVRRFNWFDFNKRHLDELRVPTPLAEGGAAIGANLMPETLKMLKNPDVTVRMRGVMEKCTYCVQRLERAKYGAKIAATEVAQGRKVIDSDPSFQPKDREASAYRKPKNPLAVGYDLDAQGRVIVPDRMVSTACEAVCPTGAIIFGNTLDASSRVAKLKKKESDYLLLGELNTKPRTSYQPRIRNLNPDLA